jgi:hypothetical protein
MKFFLINMLQRLNAIMTKLSTQIIDVELALQKTLEIKPIIKERLGFFNATILVGGLGTIFMINNILPNTPLLLNILYLIIFLLILSTWLTTNHYIHTLSIAITIMIALRFGIVAFESIDNNVLNILLACILCTTIYLDLLKRNILLQFSSLCITIYIASQYLFPSLNTETVTDYISLIKVPNLSFYTLTTIVLVLLLFPVSDLAAKTHRLTFHKIIHPILHTFLVLLITLLIVLIPFPFSPIVMLVLILLALIYALLHQSTLSIMYIIAFIISFILLTGQSKLNLNTIASALVYSLFSITILTILAKYLIDKSSKL